eukprot:2150843-Rhodomonas_salina.1
MVLKVLARVLRYGPSACATQRFSISARSMCPVSIQCCPNPPLAASTQPAFAPYFKARTGLGVEGQRNESVKTVIYA